MGYWNCWAKQTLARGVFSSKPNKIHSTMTVCSASVTQCSEEQSQFLLPIYLHPYLKSCREKKFYRFK